MGEKSEAIEKDVIREIDMIAGKYGITVNDIIKIISAKKEKDDFHVRFSKHELDIVDERCREMSLCRSSYCALCFKKAVDQELYKNIDIVQIAKRNFGEERKDHRVHISLKKFGVNAREIIRFAEDIGVDMSALLRYFSLNVHL